METKSESLWLACVHKTKRHMLRFAAATNGKGGREGWVKILTRQNKEITSEKFRNLKGKLQSQSTKRNYLVVKKKIGYFVFYLLVKSIIQMVFDEIYTW